MTSTWWWSVGLAGLTAARQLEGAEMSVAVLEARDRVGGRVLNEPIGDGKVVEVGASRSARRRTGCWRWPARSGSRRSRPIEGDDLIESGAIRRYSGEIPPLGRAALLDLQQAQVRLDRLARRVPPDAPWRTRGAERLDAQTFWSWMRRNVLTRAGRDMIRLSIEGVWAAAPEDLSLLHVLFYLRSAGGLDMLTRTGDGAQQDRFVGGSQVVADRMAEELESAVRLGAPVRRIAQDEGSVQVSADGGAELSARRVIVAVPPALCGRISSDPPLPAIRDQLTQRMPQGTVIKCMALYDEPFWRAEGLSGQVASAEGPVKVMFDNSPPDGSPGVLLGFLEERARRGRSEPAPRRSAAPRSWAASRASSAPGPRSPRDTSSGAGRTRNGAAAATGATSRRRLDRLRAVAAAADRPRALGRL